MTEQRKMVSIKDFLTDDQIRQAMKIGQDYAHDMTKMTNKLEEQVIKPNISEINRKLGQPNDTRYMAYLLTYALTSAGR